MNHLFHSNQLSTPAESNGVPAGYFALAELSKRYGYSIQHLRRLIHEGRLEAVRYGTKGHLYVRLSSLEDYRKSISQVRQEPPHAAPAQSAWVEQSASVAPEHQVVRSGRGLSPALVVALVVAVVVAGSELESRDVLTNRRAALLGHVSEFASSLNEGQQGIRNELRASLVNALNPGTPQILYVSGQTSPGDYSQQTYRTSSAVVHQNLAPEQIDEIKRDLKLQYDIDKETLVNILVSLRSDISAIQNIRPGVVLPPYVAPISNNTTPVLPISADSTNTKTLTVTEGSTLQTLTVSGDSTFSGSSYFTSGLEIAGTASVSEDLYVFGNIGIGTSSAPNQLTVVGSGSFTGQLKATRNPTQAHTGTWPSFSNANDATLYLNPDDPVADGNVIVYADGPDTKFVVDAEGDIYARSLILTGTTTQGTTLTQGDLTVEGNTQLGDASGDKIKFVGSIQPFSLTSNIFSVQASPSWTGDYYMKALDSSSGSVFVVASTSYVGIGKAVPLTTLDISGFASVSQHFEIGGNLIGSGTASSSFAGSLDITKGLRAAHITGTGLTINGSGTLSTLTVTGLTSFSNASASEGFESSTVETDSLTTSTGTLTINAFTLGGALSANSNNILNIGQLTATTASLSTNFEVGGTASISGATTLRGLTYTWPTTQDSNKFLKTDGSGTLTWATAGVASNSLDFDEFVNSMTLDANLTVASAGFAFTVTDATTTIGDTVFNTNGNVGINAGGTVNTKFEVGGTASISGALTLNGVTYALPSAQGSSGQVLTNDGSGNLTWTTKTEGLQQDFKGLSLRTSPNADVAATTVVLDHADEIVMDAGNRVSGWDDLTANIATSGAGGLDTGSEAASTWYEIYAIRKSSDGTKNLLLHRAKDYFLDEQQTTDNEATNIRTLTAQQEIAQTFDTDVTGPSEFVDVKLIKNGSPTGRIWAEIRATSGGAPTGAALKTSDKLDVSLVSTTAQTIRFVFRDPQTLTAGTTYALVINADYAINGTDYVSWRRNSAAGYAAGSTYLYDGTGPGWGAAASVDQWFKVYVTQNDTAVTMPTGYDQKAKVGWVYNDSGSNFDPFVAVNNHVQQLSGLNIASFTATIPTLTDLSAHTPPAPVVLSAELINNTVGDNVLMQGVPDGYDGSAALGSTMIVTASGANYRTPQAERHTEYQGIYLWTATGGTGNAYAMGYTWGSSGGADVAEEYLVDDESITAGDVVSLTAFGTNYVEKATASSSFPVLGVVSTKPGVRLKDWDYNPQNNRAVALTGRVPVKISNENGEVATGHRLTLSKTLPGYAMKQTEPGQSIGIALESSVGKNKVLTFLNLSYWVPNLVSLAPANTASESVNVMSAGVPSLDGLMTYVLAKFNDALDITFAKALIKTVTGIFENLEARLALFTDVKVSGSLEVSATGITIYDEGNGQPYCWKMLYGSITSVPGACAAATPTPSPEPTPQESPPSESPSPENSPEPTETPPAESSSPSATSEPSAEPTPQPAATPEPTASPTPEPTPEATPTATPTPTDTPTPEPTPEPAD